ncbi:hypothetical protein [Streptomyces sp. NPDC056194]|uniref:hypothetical protein n=1 Tax=Streptomyces sp. NPDC056194 TaxID=3345744 RepID=UPI0035DB9817
MPDFGAVLGGIGRGIAAVGRFVWEVVNTPTEADEDEARYEISRLAGFIDDEVPEELRGRAWGLVVDELRRVDTDIERMVEQTKAEVEAGAEDDGQDDGDEEKAK